MLFPFIFSLPAAHDQPSSSTRTLILSLIAQAQNACNGSIKPYLVKLTIEKESELNVSRVVVFELKFVSCAEELRSVSPSETTLAGHQKVQTE